MYKSPKDREDFLVFQETKGGCYAWSTIEEQRIKQGEIE